jgi:hypothetical protein
MPVQLRQGSKEIHINVIVDSGSYYSVLPAKCCKNEALQPTNVKLSAANRSEIVVNDRIRVDFISDEVQLNVDCLVSEAIDEFLLGSSCLCENR